MERNSVTCARGNARAYFQKSGVVRPSTSAHGRAPRTPRSRLCRPGWAPLRPLHALALSTPTPNPSSLARWCAVVAPFWLAAAYPKAISAF